MHLLEVKNLFVNYGSISALKNLNFYIDKGEIVSLVGANGAGKSTIMKTLLGIVKAQKGDICFNSQSILQLESHKIVSLGISLSPEGRMIFSDMTVEQNLKLGAYSTKAGKFEIKQQEEYVYSLFPILAERQSQIAGTLSGGEQQMLALGRALLSKPALLLLDEPSLGISPLITKQLFNIIKDLNKNGMTVLLAEQNAHMALNISSRGYVLETGQIIHTANATNLLQDDVIRKSYLGG